jgi:hypothetical protein
MKTAQPSGLPKQIRTPKAFTKQSPGLRAQRATLGHEWFDSAARFSGRQKSDDLFTINDSQLS